MSVGKLCCGVYDHRIVADEIYILYVRAFRQRMRRGHLQILGQHRTQCFTGAQIAVSRQKDICRTPAQGLVFIVCQQELNMLLLSAHHGRRRSGFRCLKRQRFFLVCHTDDDHSADQYRQQRQRNGDLKMAGDHWRAPVWFRTCTIPNAMAVATLFCRFWLSSDCRSFSSGASSTPIAGATMLFNGRNGTPMVATVKPPFLSSSETARATLWLRPRVADCAVSQGRKRPACVC